MSNLLIPPAFFRRAIRGVRRLKAANLTAEAVNTDVPVTCEFSCSDTLYNRILEIWQRSQLDNMHCCIASDRPHRERIAYTGDGQAASEMVMLSFAPPLSTRSGYAICATHKTRLPASSLSAVRVMPLMQQSLLAKLRFMLKTTLFRAIPVAFVAHFVSWCATKASFLATIIGKCLPNSEKRRNFARFSQKCAI